MTRIRYFKIMFSGRNTPTFFKCVPLDYYKSTKSLEFLRNLWLFEGGGEFPKDSYAIYVSDERANNQITYYYYLTGDSNSALLDKPSVASYEEITVEEFKTSCCKLKLVEKLKR